MATERRPSVVPTITAPITSTAKAGDDQLFGWGADDTLFGGAGDDLLAGDDEWLDYAYHGNDYLDGEEGDDRPRRARR